MVTVEIAISLIWQQCALLISHQWRSITFEKYNPSQLVICWSCAYCAVFWIGLLKNVVIIMRKCIIKMRIITGKHPSHQIKQMPMINLWLWILRYQEVRVFVAEKQGRQAYMDTNVQDFWRRHRFKHYATDW